MLVLGCDDAWPCVCSASYKNKENIDLTKVPGLARHENDVGSTEVQIARLSARVEQISNHLKANRKDFSGQRGLQLVLNQRRKLLQYLYKTDRWVLCWWTVSCAWLGRRQNKGAWYGLPPAVSRRLLLMVAPCVDTWKSVCMALVSC